MIVDSSALVALLLHETDSPSYFTAIADAASPKMSAATYVEVAIVADSRPSRARANRLDPLLEMLGIRIEPFTAEQAKIARRAYQEFGKGSGHPARLNFGDCLAYALAMEVDEPLLFKGDDF
ncbi:MAG: ribonuclease VapC, partial [Pseudonocardiales bacterium]|nr:ribonuclease VapC [Pseudonocardiales bacterium]